MEHSLGQIRTLILLAATAACSAASQPPVLQSSLLAPAPPPASARNPPPQAPAEDVEACRERILREGIPSSNGGPVEGVELARRGNQEHLQGDDCASRRSYLSLIQTSPRSPYVAFSYFALGELFKKEAAADPAVARVADASFVEVLKYRPPDNRLYLLARLRRAQTAELSATPDRARGTYQNTLLKARAHPEWDCALPVADAAGGAIKRLSSNLVDDGTEPHTPGVPLPTAEAAQELLRHILTTPGACVGPKPAGNGD